MSRDTRHLLIVALTAIVVLWVLARLRFPERAPAPSLIPPLLSQLSGRPGFAALEADVARLQRQLAMSLVSLPADNAASAATPADQRRIRHAALRIGDDIAITLLTEAVPRRQDIVAVDQATGLAIIRVPELPGSITPLPATAATLGTPRYLFAAAPTPAAIALQPILVAGLTPLAHPGWNGTVWQSADIMGVTPSTMLFTHDGELAGAVAGDDEGWFIVPASTLLADAERLMARGPVPFIDLGVEVQPLTQPLAATGIPAGVVVSWVRPDGPAAAHLLIGDGVETMNDTPVRTTREWRARLARLAPADRVTLGVVRGGTRRPAVITASAFTAAAAPLSAGLALRAIPGVGCEVLHVEPLSAAADSGLLMGDVIVSIGRVSAPSPRVVMQAFARRDDATPLVLGIARGETHRVLAMAR